MWFRISRYEYNEKTVNFWKGLSNISIEMHSDFDLSLLPQPCHKLEYIHMYISKLRCP